MKPFIIVGACARCGSWHVTDVLQRVGFSVAHETIGEDGGVGWHYLSPDEGMYKDALAQAGGRPILKLHQIREPLSAIASMTALYENGRWPPAFPPPGRYKCNHRMMDWRDDDPPLLRSMKLYYYLNASTHVSGWYRYRVEDLKSVWPTLASKLGIDAHFPVGELRVNSFKHLYTYRSLSWEILLTENVSLARRLYSLSNLFGYEEPSLEEFDRKRRSRA